MVLPLGFAEVAGSSIPVVSSALVRPSPSQSLEPSGAPPLESQSSLGLVASNASCPSEMPSPSVSTRLGLVVLPLGLAGVERSSIPVNSSLLVNPSPSQSLEPSGVPPLESQSSLGLVPSSASCPSEIPSPSVSTRLGLVVLPFGLAGVEGSSTPVVSSALVSPSLSQSLDPRGVPPLESQSFSGSVPSVFTSCPSAMPSPSESGLNGSVPAKNSSSLISPSLSQSLVANGVPPLESQSSFGLVPSSAS